MFSQKQIIIIEEDLGTNAKQNPWRTGVPEGLSYLLGLCVFVLCLMFVCLQAVASLKVKAGSKSQRSPLKVSRALFVIRIRPVSSLCILVCVFARRASAHRLGEGRAQTEVPDYRFQGSCETAAVGAEETRKDGHVFDRPRVFHECGPHG